MEIIDIAEAKEKQNIPDEMEERNIEELDNDNYLSTEFLFTCFSILESRGFIGWNEFMSVLDNDYQAILKILRLFGGMTIRIPPLEEFRLCLLASTFAYYDLYKRNEGNTITKKSAKLTLDQLATKLQFSPEDRVKIDIIYNNWLEYMDKEGYPIDNLFKIARQDTKRRFRSFRNPSKPRKRK